MPVPLRSTVVDASVPEEILSFAVWSPIDVGLYFTVIVVSDIVPSVGETLDGLTLNISALSPVIDNAASAVKLKPLSSNVKSLSEPVSTLPKPSELSEDLSIDKTDDNLIYDNVLLDGISKFEKKTNIID